MVSKNKKQPNSAARPDNQSNASSAGESSRRSSRHQPTPANRSVPVPPSDRVLRKRFPDFSTLSLDGDQEEQPYQRVITYDDYYLDPEEVEAFEQDDQSAAGTSDPAPARQTSSIASQLPQTHSTTPPVLPNLRTSVRCDSAPVRRSLEIPLSDRTLRKRPAVVSTPSLDGDQEEDPYQRVITFDDYDLDPEDVEVLEQDDPSAAGTSGPAPSWQTSSIPTLLPQTHSTTPPVLPSLRTSVRCDSARVRRLVEIPLSDRTLRKRPAVVSAPSLDGDQEEQAYQRVTTYDDYDLDPEDEELLEPDDPSAAGTSGPAPSWQTSSIATQLPQTHSTTPPVLPNLRTSVRSNSASVKRSVEIPLSDRTLRKRPAVASTPSLDSDQEEQAYQRVTTYDDYNLDPEDEEELEPDDPSAAGTSGPAPSWQTSSIATQLPQTHSTTPPVLPNLRTSVRCDSAPVRRSVEIPLSDRTLRKRPDVVRPEAIVLRAPPAKVKAEEKNRLPPFVFVLLKTELKLSVIVTCAESKVQIGAVCKTTGRYRPAIPNLFAEAKRAEKAPDAGWRQKTNLQIPGLPKTKFTSANLGVHGKPKTDMAIQMLYRSSKGGYYTYYEGWACDMIDITQPVPSNDIQPWQIREQLVETIWGRQTDWNLENGALGDPFHHFWIFEDMSAFHSAANHGYGDGLIFYLLPPDLQEVPKPPVYTYTPIPILTEAFYDWLKLDQRSWPFEEQKIEWQRSQDEAKARGEKLTRKNQNSGCGQKGNICETPATCVCRRRFNYLFESDIRIAEYVIQNGTVFLDVEKHAGGLVMECSDACGCSRNCPRRRLQQGQKCHLAVCYVKEEGWFELRAASFIKKGELIIEYVGELLNMSYSNDKSYDATCPAISDKLVIAGKHVANVARFGNHKCVPNAAFFQIYSRTSDDEPVLPRIGLFAKEDINPGDQITINYYGDKKGTKKNGIRCRCGLPDDLCKIYLPT